MSLAPSDPSMLDMRDAMLTADKAIYGKAHWAALWRAFAHRGFGYFAASVDAADPEPIEDFHVPPPAGATQGSISGTVTDTNGSPLAGAVVLVAGQGEDAATVTNQNGGYTIDGLVEGTYPKVAAFAAGYETAVPARHGRRRRDRHRLRAAPRLGGLVRRRVDRLLRPARLHGVRLRSRRGDRPLARHRLGQRDHRHRRPGRRRERRRPEVDRDRAPGADRPSPAFAVDPSATCGDAGSSSTADYTIEVGSSAAGPWTVAASGTFGPSPTAAAHGRRPGARCRRPAPPTCSYTMAVAAGAGLVRVPRRLHRVHLHGHHGGRRLRRLRRRLQLGPGAQHAELVALRVGQGDPVRSPGRGCRGGRPPRWRRTRAARPPRRRGCARAAGRRSGCAWPAARRPRPG